jgi:3-oxoacyl-[acyl-carrier protein] reductase
MSPSNLNLDGRVAYVTGSTRGIGWAIASTLALSGATVVLNCHRDVELLQARVAELETLGVPVLGQVCDVADATQVQAVYRTIFKQFKRLDVLINNAGILGDALVGMIPAGMVDRTLAVNTKGAIHNLQGAARLMARNKSGSIVNVTSIVGTHGNAGQVVYSASKAALIGLTMSASKELAPQGIRVNAIAPGYIDTEMIRHLDAETHQRRLASIAMGRVGKPEDVALAALYFASDMSSYVTGQILGVDGGMQI